MRQPSSHLIVLMVLIAAAFSAKQGQPYNDYVVLQYAKSIDVVKLDSTLSSQRLEDWLLRGPARIDELYWNISHDCDLQVPEPDADGNLPLCVKVGFRRGKMTGFGMLKVGTLKQGVIGQPAFLYLDVLRPFSVGSYDKLSDFPRFLDGIDQTHDSKNEIHLRATVQDVVPLPDYSGKVTPVDLDPRFALTVRIESVNPAVSDFTAGAVIAFAIHSPALLFRGDVTKGKTCEFSLQHDIRHGRTRFSDLKVQVTSSK
jgi:hypothetical protein